MPYDMKQPTKEIGGVIKKRVDDFYQFILSYGILGIWRKSHHQYFAGFYSGASIQYAGTNGELWEMSINDYRNLIQHLAMLISGQDVKWDVRAINTDEKSQKQAMLIPTLLDYYEKYGGAREEAYRAVEYNLVLGDGYLMSFWDPMGGEVATYEERTGTNEMGEEVLVNNPIRTGDVRYKALSPIDVIFDPTQKEWSGNQWVIVREFKNKYELADQFPEYRQDIEGMDYKWDFMRDLDEDYPMGRNGDYIVTYTLFHKPTLSMPFGRRVMVVGDDLVVQDDDLPHREIPVYRMTTAFLDRTPFGYSVGYDLLPLQRSQDVLTSIILSNQTMFGVQNIVVPDGSNVSAENLSGGFNVIKYPPGTEPPKALSLVSTPQEIPRMRDDISQRMEVLSGVNSVTRGSPQANVTAGNAMALLQAQTIQFSIQAQRAYVDMREKCALNTLDLIKRNLKVEKAVGITGKMPGQFINTFRAEDLDGIQRVTLDLGNPSTKTAMGRRAMADALLQYGAIKDPDKYVQIAETGNLEIGTEDKMFEGLLIRNHQERLMAGEMPDIIWTDNHARFIQMALNLANTPVVRENDQILPVVLQYIQNHIDISLETDPMKVAAIGRPPLVAPMGPEAGGPPQPGAPQPGGAQGGAPAQSPGAGAAGEQPMPGIPPGQNFPTNPATGGEWNPATGG